MRVEQGVKIFPDNEGIYLSQLNINEYFLVEYRYSEYVSEHKAYMLNYRTKKGRNFIADISEKENAIKIAKLLNEDRGGKNE